MRGLIAALMLSAGATLVQTSTSQISHIPKPPEIVDSRRTIDSIIVAHGIRQGSDCEYFDKSTGMFNYSVTVLYDSAFLEKSSGLINTWTKRIFDDANVCLKENHSKDGMLYGLHIEASSIELFNLNMPNSAILDASVILDLMRELYPNQYCLYLTGHDIVNRETPKNIIAVHSGESSRALYGLTFLNGYHMILTYSDEDLNLFDDSTYSSTSNVFVHEFLHTQNALHTCNDNTMMNATGVLSYDISRITGRQVSVNLIIKYNLFLEDKHENPYK